MKWLYVCLAVALAGTGISAEDLAKTMEVAAGRKRVAESGVKAIKASPSASVAAKAAYDAAATSNNAWLETVLAGAEAPVLDAAATLAATTFRQWIAARRPALDEAPLAEAMMAAVERDTRRNLLDLAADAARSYRGTDARTRERAAVALEPLRWTSWDQLP